MFKEALPVWQKGKEKEMNYSMLFKTVILCNENSGKRYVVRIAASTVYQLFINGKFITTGPCRTAHGYYRVDEIDITEDLDLGDNVVAILVAGYNINNYYTLNQPSFLQAEIVEETYGIVLAATGSCNPFYSRPYKERIKKTDKYSFQRTFTEVYKLNSNYNMLFTDVSIGDDFLVPTHTDSKKFIERRIPTYTHPECNVDKIIARGTCSFGEKPKEYLRTRHVANIGPMQLGYKYDELDVCLEDVAQEFKFEPVKVSEDYEGSDKLFANDIVVYSLDSERTGFIAAGFICKEDADLYIMFDERINEHNDVEGLANGCTNVIKIEMEKGSYDFISFESYGFKYIKFVCTKGEVEVRNVKVREYICSVPLMCLEEFIDNDILQDEKLRKVLESAVNTYKQNAVDIFMDCPTRERAGWLCDSFFTARAEKVFTGENAIEYNFLENFLLPEKFEHLPKGMLPMCYPSDHYDKVFIPNWAMWFVKELYDFVKRNEDNENAKELAEKLKDRVYELLDYFKKFENEYGLLEKLESWVFVEWSRANDFVQDVNYPSNMLYSSTLENAGRLYNDDKLIEKAEKIKEVILERSFNGEFFVDNEIRKDGVLVSTNETSETCQYYAFFMDIATPDTHKALWGKLVDEMGPKRDASKTYPNVYPSNAFIGAVLRLDLLKRFGYTDKLKEEIKDYFYYMAEKTGTLWENLTPEASCNHGFTSYVAYLLSNKKY
jgi:alpha-L-rhamnosidase